MQTTIKKLQTLAKNENLKLITTEKDFFRLKQLGFKKIDYIIVDLIISEYKKFEKEILKQNIRSSMSKMMKIENKKSKNRTNNHQT